MIHDKINLKLNPRENVQIPRSQSTQKFVRSKIFTNKVVLNMKHL